MVKSFLVHELSESLYPGRWANGQASSLMSKNGYVSGYHHLFQSLGFTI